MEDSITSEHLEWLICTEIPIKVSETVCWGAIIWEKWGPKLKVCPNRCSEAKIVLQDNKFVQRMISGLPAKCEFCAKEYPRRTLIAHKTVCDANILKPVILSDALHSWWLIKQQKENLWHWDGLKLIDDGWAGTGKTKQDVQGGESWYCKYWDVDFCEACIAKYSQVHERYTLRRFEKENKHLSHQHPLKFIFGSDLPKSALINWYGKHKSKGCVGMDKEDTRYLVWIDWRLVIWEYWYLSPKEDFIQFVANDYHDHFLKLTAISPHEHWKCNGGLETWLKASRQSNFTWKVAYKCELCNFYSCIECLKKKVIKL